MTTGSTTHPVRGTDQDAIVRLGGWLFRRRSWLPVPIVVALLVIPAPSRPPLALWFGIVVAALGEALRLWAVHHIGVISRTRSDRLGPLIATGPFGYVRNPLYVGNIALWLGFTVSAGLFWLVPIVLGLLLLEYHAIVRWEEGLLASRMGRPYEQYLRHVPRWLPRFRPLAVDAGPPVPDRDQAMAVSGTARSDGPPASSAAPASDNRPQISGSAAPRHRWKDTLVSERSTLIAVVIGALLLWLKG
jgi:protein-S-isoprenylcysteine O-methyltransferase Ste14